MKIILVYNPSSGSSLTKGELRTKCRKAGIVIEKLIPIDDQLTRHLKPFLASDTTIATIGGDGTLSAVAAIVGGTQAVLAPLPGGTLNHFTKDLGIPQDIDEALERLARSKVRSIDIASVNDIYFINNSSIGLYPSSLRTRTHFEDKIGKWPAAVIASVRALMRFRSYEVAVDEQTFRTPFVFVGNNEYKLDVIGGSVRTQLDRGVLSVFVARTISRLTLLKIALWALIGKAHLLDEFDSYQTTSLTISTHAERLSVSHDGEVSRMQSPLRYKIHTKKLRIRV